MRASKLAKQQHAWHHVALFAGLGLFALWSLSLFDSPRLSPGELAVVGSHEDASAHLVDVVHPTSSRKRLLLSTHNRLFWYYPDTDEDVPVHAGQVTSSPLMRLTHEACICILTLIVQGVYYGAFPGDLDTNGSPTVWVVSRPHNWRPQRVEEKLLNINLDSGDLIDEVTIPSRYADSAQQRTFRKTLLLLQKSFP